MSRANSTKFILTIILLFSILESIGAIDRIPIGIIARSKDIEHSLNRSLDMMNSDNKISVRIMPVLEIVDTDNSYQTSMAVCRLLSKKVWAIIGDQSIELLPIIKSITSHYHIPFITMSWQPDTYYLNNSTTVDKSIIMPQMADDVPQSLNYSLNLYPGSDQLSQAYLDLIRYKGWKSFTIVYESPEEFVLVKKLFEMSNTEAIINLQRLNLEQEGELNIMSDVRLMPEERFELNKMDSDFEDDDELDFRYCDFSESSTNLGYHRTVKELKKKHADNIVLSLPVDKICTFLKVAATNASLSTVYNDFVLANLDIHLLNLTGLKPFAANLSGYTILDYNGQPTNFVPSKQDLGRRPTHVKKKLLPTAYTMMSDSVTLLAYAIDELVNDMRVEFNANSMEPSCDCGKSDSEPWLYGEELMSRLKRVRDGSYSGVLKFDPFGQRVDFGLDYIIHRNGSFQKIGEWKTGNKLIDNDKGGDEFGREIIKNRTLIVSISKETPYVQLRANHKDLTGNDKYEGYCIDLVKKIAEKLHFNFILREVPDGQYGKIINGSWNGMIRELLDRHADLAIVDLTITKERQSAVDFTHPFMTLGIAIMYKKPKIQEAEMYSFMMPFSTEVWLSMWSAYVGMSLAIWIVARCSPLEWVNPHPCYDDPNEWNLENEIHSIGASMWFTIGSLMQQGSDLAPRSPSVRSLASVWYFFTLILMSSYTANFAAFLTASRMQSPIESAEDLSKQTKIDYGCKDGGSTQNFFASSNHSTYRRMWNFMESRKHSGVFPKDNNKGISMVKKGNFAFLMESTSIEYMVQRDCELTQIGGLLDHKGYGIALPKRSPYRSLLSRTIVDLNEAGELQDLKSRWWNNPNGTVCTEEEDSASATSELGIDKVGGVFVMLGFGVLIASIAALLEFIWKSLKISRNERDSIKALLWREFVKIVTCGPSKRLATNPTYDMSQLSQSVGNMAPNGNEISGPVHV